MDTATDFIKYCEENLDLYDVDLGEVLERMDIDRLPLYQASQDIESQLQDLTEIFCDENGIESENFIEEYFGSTDELFLKLEIF